MSLVESDSSESEFNEAAEVILNFTGPPISCSGNVPET